MLFPGEDERHLAATILRGGGNERAPSLPSGWKAPVPPVPSVVDVHTPSSFPEPSGRAQALRLASQISRQLPTPESDELPPALSSRAWAALRTPADPAAAGVIAAHQDLLALRPEEIVPQLPALDHAYRELGRQVG